MKKSIRFIAFLALMLAGCSLYSQAQVRYRDEVFTSYTIDTVAFTVHGSDTLKMDIYQPVGDTFATRPVILLAHGGSFVVQGGYRNDDPAIVKLCQTFAKHGYITATYDYRLASNITSLLDSIQALDVVMKAIADGKGAVRYFRQDAATTNTYRVDTSQIFVGGNSAGAILAVHLAYIDSIGEVPQYIADVIDSNGGIDGDAGNQGYSSKAKAVINLAGGINMLAWYGPGSIPMVSCQGDQDGTVPYECDGVLSATAQPFHIKTVNICGCGAMKPVADAEGLEDSLLTFPGDDHVPWENNTTKMNQVIAFVDTFLYKHTVDISQVHTGINNIDGNSGFGMYPNPAQNTLTINNHGNQQYNLSVYNMLGQEVLRKTSIAGNVTNFDISALNNGVYVVKMFDATGKETLFTDKLQIIH